MWKIRLTPFEPFPPTTLLRPLLLLAFSIWVGSLLHTTFSPQTFLAIALSGAVASFAFGRKGKGGIGKGRERLSALCAAVTFIAAAIALTLLSYSRVLFPWSEEAALRVVQVENVVKETADEMRCDVTVMKGEGEGHTLRLTLEGKPRPQVGDLLALNAKVTLPGEESKQWKGYRDFLVHHGISGIAHVSPKRWKLLPGEPPLKLRHRLERMRRSLVETFHAHFAKTGAAFLAALTLGDRSSLSAETRELFSQMGVAHVLALSGLHLGVLFTLFHFFVRRERMSPKLYLTAEILFFLCIWLFVFLAGASLSLQRAATMFTLMQLGQWFQRGGQSGDNLCLAAFLILLFSPLSLFDLGFQLSVISVAGILAGQHFLWSRLILSPFHPLYTLLYSKSKEKQTKKGAFFSKLKNRMRLLLRETLLPFLAISLTAQLVTMPLVLSVFHFASPYALLSNLLAVPAVTLLLFFSLLFLCLPFARPWLADVMSAVLDMTEKGLSTLSRLPGATWQIHVSDISLWLVALGLFFLFVFLLTRRKRLWIGLFVVFTSAGLLWESRVRWEERRQPRIEIFSSTKTPSMLLVASESHAYLVSGVSPDTVRNATDVFGEEAARAILHTEPQVVKNDFRDHFLMRRRQHLLLANVSVVWADSTALHTAPHAVDVLVVTPECPKKASQLLLTYRPRRVVLTGRQPVRFRTALREACEKEQIPFHNTQTDGTFVLRLHSEEGER